MFEAFSKFNISRFICTFELNSGTFLTCNILNNINRILSLSYTGCNSTLVGNNNEPPQKYVESHNCVIPYTIVSWIVSIETSQNWSKLVKTGQKLSKLVKTGQNL